MKVTTTDAENLLVKYQKNIPDFILGHGWFKTKDEHDDRYPAKPLPDKPYCWAYLEELCKEQYVLVAKSRQLVVTWLTLAYLVAKVTLFRNLLVIYQTKREDDAFEMIVRCKFLYDHLPVWVKHLRPRIPTPRDVKEKLVIPKTNSFIWALPQGGDIIRSNTVSIYYGDEFDFQPEARKSLRAVMPSIIGGGQFIVTSTPNLGGPMQALIKGEDLVR